MRPIVTVGSRKWEAITKVDVERSVEAACGAFRVEGTLKAAVPVREGSRVRIVTTPPNQPSIRVANGWVDRADVAVSNSGRTISVSGRDITSDLVDSTWPEWPAEWTDTTLLQIARDIALPLGVPVDDEIGEPLPIPRFAVNPGETGWDVISRAALQVGVLAITTGNGHLAITRQTRIRSTTPLIEGQNISQLRGTYDLTRRYSEYIVRGQAPTTDEVQGEAATEVEGRATDPAVRTQRKMLILSDGATDRESATLRAAWEANVRAARGQAVTCRVQGWLRGGRRQLPWVPWNIVRCEMPSLGISGDLLVSKVRHSFSAQGTTTDLTLVRPDSFLTEPVDPDLDLAEGLEEAMA